MNAENQFEKMTFTMAKNLAAPHTWVASVMPSVYGVAFCFYFGLNLDIVRAVMFIAVCVLMQSAVNVLNDYFDYVKGSDSKEDTLEAYDAVLVYNNINPKNALALGIGFLAAAAVLGIAAAWGRGIAPYVIGIIGGLCVIFYSGGKKPISYMPLGELVSGLVMGGFIPVAIVSAATGSLGKECLIAFIGSIPLIIGIGMIMMTNNTCDIEKDIEANRVTFPVKLGREKARKFYGTTAKVWMALEMIIAVMLMGTSGIVAAALVWFAARPRFRFLWTSPLTQENRIMQMKGIIQANVIGNGVYVFFLLLEAVLSSLLIAFK